MLSTGVAVGGGGERNSDPPLPGIECGCPFLPPRATVLDNIYFFLHISACRILRAFQIPRVLVTSRVRLPLLLPNSLRASFQNFQEQLLSAAVGPCDNHKTSGLLWVVAPESQAGWAVTG